MSPCDHFVKKSNIVYILKFINVWWLQRIGFYVLLCPNQGSSPRSFLHLPFLIRWLKNTCDRTLLRKMLFRSFVAYRRTPLMLESNPPCQQYFFESGSCMKKEHCVIRHSLIFKGIFPKTDQRCPLLYTWESIGPTVNVMLSEFRIR